MESGGKWSLIPGSELDTSSAPAGVTEQLSFTGRDTAMNQENWLTAQQASYRNTKRSVFFNTNITICTTKKKNLNTTVIKLFCSGRFYNLPLLDVHQGDCYGSHFLSSARWAEYSMTVHQTSAPPPPFFFFDGMAHTPPQAVRISGLEYVYVMQVQERTQSQDGTRKTYEDRNTESPRFCIFSQKSSKK